jgi:hypothetical protein
LPDTAKVLHRRTGEPVVTDGPTVASKEQIARPDEGVAVCRFDGCDERVELAADSGRGYVVEVVAGAG